MTKHSDGENAQIKIFVIKVDGKTSDEFWIRIPDIHTIKVCDTAIAVFINKLQVPGSSIRLDLCLHACCRILPGIGINFCLRLEYTSCLHTPEITDRLTNSHARNASKADIVGAGNNFRTVVDLRYFVFVMGNIE